jgi:hypothetical protein
MERRLRGIDLGDADAPEVAGELAQDDVDGDVDDKPLG